MLVLLIVTRSLHKVLCGLSRITSSSLFSFCFVTCEGGWNYYHDIIIQRAWLIELMFNEVASEEELRKMTSEQANDDDFLNQLRYLYKSPL